MLSDRPQLKWACLSITISLGLFCSGCVRNREAKGAAAAPSAVKPSLRELQERIAKQFAEASPMADPGDTCARDSAAARLVECRDFLGAVGERLLWGGCEPVKGYDPKTYSLTEFDPFVWLKLYGSTLMFTGEYEVKPNGPFSVLELKAKFRSNLDPGDYPYPFWHSPKKWQAYLDLASLCVVFRDDKIVAVYRVAQPDPSNSPAERKWDGKWQWTDAVGNQQPRVALFTYMFGADNPHRAGVDNAYRQLEKQFRAHDCTSCHAPDNAGKAKALLLLNYPNQSLFARHTLLQTLKNNEMPPEDSDAHKPAGITDHEQRAKLIRLAQNFVQKADAAVAFESSRKAVTPKAKSK
jgi:hypothetical protein